MVRPWEIASERVPPELRPLLPRQFDIVGHVVILRLPRELEPHAKAVGEAYLEAVPPARTVAHDLGAEGAFRVRRLEVLAGDPETRVAVRENGLTLEFDLAHVYYSPRLATERLRVAEHVRPGELVWDATCGVGPYALLIARRGARVVATDPNAHAVAAGRANARRNKVLDRVLFVQGDALHAPLRQPVDRAVANLPHAGHVLWPVLARHVRPGGTVHLAFVARRGEEAASAEALAVAVPGGHLVAWRPARAISSSQVHVVVDLEVGQKSQ